MNHQDIANDSYESRLTDTEVLGGSLEERVLRSLSRLGGEGRGGGLLARTFTGLGGLVIEARYISNCPSAVLMWGSAGPVHSEL